MSRWKFMWGPGLAVLILSGCGAPAQSSADYPHYDRASLLSEATLIIEGVSVAVESSVLIPRYTGETPEQNPVLGLSADDKQKALGEADGIEATAVTFRIAKVHRGDARPGDEVLIIQTNVSEEVPLQVSRKYLLFTRDGLEGTFTILGASAGAYVSSGDESFTAVSPEDAPYTTITSSEIAALAG
ncbi:hypothetical protein ACU045_12710 [Microbacterium sp. MAHUQ-60]|uniref:hypothetical protein n=1 Tax=unclassified Microbacterium TaxID=2609290 RepID=UPI003609D681